MHPPEVLNILIRVYLDAVLMTLDYDTFQNLQYITSGQRSTWRRLELLQITNCPLYCVVNMKNLLPYAAMEIPKSCCALTGTLFSSSFMKFAMGIPWKQMTVLK